MKKLIALLLCWPLLAGAVEYHLTPTGAGATDGSDIDNAYAGMTDWGTTGLSAGDRLCVYGTFTGTADAQVSTMMLRLLDGGSAGNHVVYDGDCDGDGNYAVLDCNDEVNIGIAADTSVAQTEYITVRRFRVRNCLIKGLRTWQNATTDATNDANQLWEYLVVEDIGDGDTGDTCFDSRGNHIELSNSTLDGCDDDAVFHRGTDFRSDGLTTLNFSRATDTGDGMQISGGNGARAHVSNYTCTDSADAKQCLIIAELDDNATGGIVVEDFVFTGVDGATVGNGLFVEGDGTIVRRGLVNGFNQGVLLGGTDGGLGPVAENVSIQSVVVRGSTTACIAASVGAGAGNEIVHNVADGCAIGIETRDTGAITIQNNLVMNNSGCGIELEDAGQSESYNDSYANGTAFCRDGGSISAGTGSLTADPQLVSDAPTAAADYAISRSSPLFAAGTAAAGVTTDYLGNNFRATPSIGAFESYDVYVNCGADSNGTGSFASPYNTFEGYDVLSNDNIYLWPDVTCVPWQSMTADHMIELGTGDDGVTIGLYPDATEACNPDSGEGCAKLDGQGELNIGIYARSADDLRIEDVWTHDYLYHGIRHFGDELSDHAVSLYRVRASEAGPTVDADNTYTTLSKGDCIFFGRGSHGAQKTTVYTEDVSVDRCSRLGTDHRWWIEAVHHRYHGSRTGYDRAIGGHGISAHPLSADISGGWSAEGGGVYSQAVVSSNDDEQLIQDKDTSPNIKLERTTDDDTTPDEGYFSIVSGTTIYANFGYDPGSNQIRIIRQPIKVDVYDGRFWGNMLRDDGNLEGTGFHSDDTSPMRCFRCASWENEGNGFFFNHSMPYPAYPDRKPGCYGCVAWNNGSDYCTGTSCGKGFHGTGEFDLVNISAANSLRENVSMSGRFNTCGTMANVASVGGRWGLRFQADAETKCWPAGVVAYGASAESCPGGFPCTEADPMFVGGDNPTDIDHFKPLPGSPLLDAGVCTLDVGCTYPDIDGRRPSIKPDIGAIQRN